MDFHLSIFILDNATKLLKVILVVQSSLLKFIPVSFFPINLLLYFVLLFSLTLPSSLIFNFCMFTYLVEKHNLINMISATNRCIAQKQALLYYLAYKYNRNDKTEMFSNFSMLMNKQKGKMKCSTNGHCSMFEC